MFSVIIPVLNELDLTMQLFNCISKNTILPSEIILIDNASIEDFSSITKKYENLNIKYLRNEKNLGVNASWNVGISLSRYKYISFLNNDIIISTSFFKKISDVFESNCNVGIVVPNTLKDKECSLEDDNLPIIKNLNKREGWAFTIRKTLLSKIDPIPKELKLFFGDDYLFSNSLKHGYINLKIMNNLIYHYGSITIKKELKSLEKETLEREREIWKRIRVKENLDGKN